MAASSKGSSRGRSIWHRPKYITTTNAKAAHTEREIDGQREGEGALSELCAKAFAVGVRLRDHHAVTATR